MFSCANLGLIQISPWLKEFKTCISPKATKVKATFLGDHFWLSCNRTGA